MPELGLMYIRGRKYVRVFDAPREGDVVRWRSDAGVRTNRVVRTGGRKELWLLLARHEHEGDRPFKVSASAVQCCWRWHKRAGEGVEDVQTV